MVKMVKKKLNQQHENNKTFLKEMERIRAEIDKLRETTPSILQPRILNFNSVGSLGNHRDTATSTPDDASTLGATPNNQTPMMQGPNETFITF